MSTAKPPTPSLEEKVEAVVEDWSRECMANSRVSGDTESWNHFTAAKVQLKQRLVTALKGD